MSATHRTATLRWLLGGGMLAAAVWLWPDLRGQGVFLWLALGSVAALAAVVQHLGIHTDLGRIGFLPVVALTAYMALGRNAALGATTAGLLVGGALWLAVRLPRGDEQTRRWWELAGEGLVPVGANGLGLLAADLGYRAFDASPPLTGIERLPELLPLVASPLLYLLAYDLALVAGRWLKGTPVGVTLRQKRRAILAIQLLPLIVAPFAAIAWTQLGALAFFIFQAILLALAIVIRRLMAAQRTLEVQVDQLQTLAAANARIYEEVDVQLARRVGQIVRMADISQQLSATLDMDAIFKLVVQSALEGCNADAGVLVLSGDPEQGYGPDGEPHMVAWRGFDRASALRAPHLIAHELATSPVLEKGETRLISADDSRAAGPSSQLGVPILLEGQVIGAIALESESRNAFSQEDLSFVSQLAVQAAVAIRNAQLYRHAQSVRDRLHAILDASNDGLVMIDPKGRIVMTNTRMEDFWDFAREDFQAPSPDQFAADPLSGLGQGLGYKPGELAALLRRGARNPMTKPQTDIYATRSLPGQRQRSVERTAAPVLDDNGQFIGLLLIFRDVTEQKELEEARQNLTSMIVHELRSPLQAVMGSMRLIAEVTGNEEPIVEQATDVSRRAVKKLLNLVNNLLDLSRMEQGEFVLDPSFETLRPILDDAVQELMPLAQEMSTVMRVEVPDDLPTVQVDRDMIGRVVLNLLDNALKYSEPGSLVSVEAVLQPEPGTAGRPVVCVRVTDNGPGIPDEHKEAVFDRFSQIPGRRGRRRSAGLGLAFCKMALESHGGQIWVEDNPEGGSVFIFSLPAGPPAEPRQGGERALPARRTRQQRVKRAAPPDDNPAR